MGIAYTYSKSHGDGEAGGQEGASFQDPRDRPGSRGIYSFDQTHRTVGEFRLGDAWPQHEGVAGRFRVGK